MPRHRLTPAWIACFAVLFNLLVMPLSSAAPKSPAEQILWGAFCSTNGPKLVAISLGTPDNAQQNDDHSSMQHCWCCSGSPPLLGINGQPPHLVHPQQTLLGTATLADHYTPTPRQQWPSINPRASPFA